MNYQDVKQIINSTLQGREKGHMITPLEHQSMIMAVLEYLRFIRKSVHSILQGFASIDINPVLNGKKISYVTLCPSNTIITFKYLLGENGLPIQVICYQNEIKFVILFFNGKFWEKAELNLGFGEPIITLGDFNFDFNSDFKII